MPRKKQLDLKSKFLVYLLALGDAVSVLFPTPREFRRRAYWGKYFDGYPQFKNTLYYLYKKGYIEYEDKDHKRFVKLTQNGELEALLAKARLGQKQQVWDGKWRIIMYDIPEASKDKRHHFRWLLKQNNFYKLQASVFISPYALNREALQYLKEKHLYHYVRILKVEEIDDDADLRKHFRLA